jgi:TrmH family RNA methyltransferase
LMLVEGWDEISLALEAGHTPLALVTDPTRTTRPLAIRDIEAAKVGEKVFGKISQREHPDGWIALFQTPTRTLATLSLRKRPLVVVLESLEKPGNLGAVLRTADAAGADAVIVCDPLADIYGPNVVRSSRGTVFSVPVVQASSSDAIAYLRSHAIEIVAATPHGTTDYTQRDLAGSVALALGTESKGLSRTWLSAADTLVTIPMHGRVNSLNVSVAAATLIFEALRQRKAVGRPPEP